MKIFTYIKDNSSRLERKNFRHIGNKEMWKHLIHELSDFDVYIDTDSSEVIRECNTDELLGRVIAYPREDKFIDIENDPKNKISPANLMVDSFLDNYVTDDDEVVVVTHVTSPFLRKETIMDAVSYLDKGYEFVHSVYERQDFAWMGDDYVPINFDPSVVQRTQDVPKLYFSNGAFFIFRKRDFKKYNNRLGKHNYYYPLSLVEAVEIDNLHDLDFAKLIYRGIV